MSKKNGTGINPGAALRMDRLIKPVESNIDEPEQTISDEANIKKDNKWEIEIPEKPKKKQFTQVRIEDNVVEGFKNYLFKNRIDIGYTKVMNEVLKKFLEENGIK